MFRERFDRVSKTVTPFNCSPGLRFGTRQDRVGVMYLC